MAISFGLFRIALRDRDARGRQRRCQAQARRRRGVSSAQRRAATRSPHANATWAMEATTRAFQRVRSRAPSPPLGSPTGASSPHVGQQRRHHSRRYKFAPAQLAPIHWRRVRACWLMHVSMGRRRPPNIGPNAQYCRIRCGHLRPPCRNLRLLASQNLRVVADGLSPSKAQS